MEFQKQNRPQIINRMEIQTNNHLNRSLVTPLNDSSSSQTNEDSNVTPHKTTDQRTALIKLKKSLTQLSRSNSSASSNLEIERELQKLELDSSLNKSGSISLGADLNICKSNRSLSGASIKVLTVKTTNLTIDIGTGEDGNNVSADTSILTNGCSGGTITKTHISGGTGGGCVTTNIKKRIFSGRTPTCKARRVKFYRNGDRFYPGITIPVSNERYRSFESLFKDLTRLLEEYVKIPGAVRSIYTMSGKKISTLEELEDGQSYVCSCNNEIFKKIDYNTLSQPLITNLTLSRKSCNRFSKNYRSSCPLKTGNSTNTNVSGSNVVSDSPILQKINERDSFVHPRIVTLIRNGTKPRKIMRLLLNKRNSPSFEHVLTAFTQKLKPDTGYVRKVFTLSGTPVTKLADFFGVDDVFFAYGTERVSNPDDFKLETDEQKTLQAIRKTIRTISITCKDPRPKMPIKSKKTKDEEKSSLLNKSGINANDLPISIWERYIMGQIIGDGNFAVVFKIMDRQNGRPYALKIIDKSKCRGKEHYIDAEVRVMKKLSHPYIISLIMDVDQQANKYLVLEYISGGDLFEAITRVKRFSQNQARIMIRHLASAMSYLHSLSIVHRDIKPENVLVELDNKGGVVKFKLADFGLACEVTEPLFAVCGTPTYVAPEILLETGYGLKIDVWAAGIILYILLCGFPPFVSPDNKKEPLFNAIISGFYEFPEPYWTDIGDEVRDLINNMLQSDPDLRFTSEDILDHFWTKGNNK